MRLQLNFTANHNAEITTEGLFALIQTELYFINLIGGEDKFVTVQLTTSTNLSVSFIENTNQSIASISLEDIDTGINVTVTIMNHSFFNLSCSNIRTKFLSIINNKLKILITLL